eukprot:NODE_218_length_12464_cov_0.653781.p11 type:complete len:156 gc:universal NODE_218_length_12464_cov_0.653781:8767-8300(-)
MNSSTIFQLSTSFNGMACGALLFVGFVDGKALKQLLEKKNDAVVKQYFQQWWPKGASLMVPLQLGGFILSSTAFYLNRNYYWLLSAASYLSTFLWTGFVMGEDISNLMNSDQEELHKQVENFTFTHWARVGFSIVGLVACNVALFQVPKSFCKIN